MNHGIKKRTPARPQLYWGSFGLKYKWFLSSLLTRFFFFTTGELSVFIQQKYTVCLILQKTLYRCQLEMASNTSFDGVCLCVTVRGKLYKDDKDVNPGNNHKDNLDIHLNKRISIRIKCTLCKTQAKTSLEFQNTPILHNRTHHQFIVR